MTDGGWWISWGRDVNCLKTESGLSRVVLVGYITARVLMYCWTVLSADLIYLINSYIQQSIHQIVFDIFSQIS